MSDPPVMEMRRLSWPGHEELCPCERVSPTHFRVFFSTVIFPEGGGMGEPRPVPSKFWLDGVAVTRFHVGSERHENVQLELELAHPLELVRFIPYRSHLLRSGEMSFEWALQRAQDVGFPLDQSRIVERADYWLFPVFQIGTLGVAVWRNGRVSEIGSGLAGSLDDWEWALERGLLEKTGALVVEEVLDPQRAGKLLKELGGRERSISERLTSPPAAFKLSELQVRRHSLSKLREDGGRSFRWHVAPLDERLGH